jgi:hypothetical protein
MDFTLEFENNNIIFNALKKNNYEYIQKYIHNNSDKLFNIFEFACLYSDNKVLEMFIHAGIKLNNTNSKNIIQYICNISHFVSNKIDTLNFLVNHGLDLSESLKIAINSNVSLEIIEYLINSGANINECYNYGNSPIMAILLNTTYSDLNKLEIIEFLLSCKNIDLEIKNQDGNTILLLFVINYIQLIEYQMTAIENILNILIYAIKKLLSKNVDIYSKNNKNQSFDSFSKEYPELLTFLPDICFK